MKIDKDIIMRHDSQGEPQGCVVVLPGRGISASLMERFMLHAGLWRSMKIILEPRNLEWYPAPNGPEDQQAAIWGQEVAVKTLDEEVKRIERAWGFKKKDIVWLGFSAGAVMSLWMAAQSNEPYAGVVALAGAILNPAGLPKAKNDTPIVVQHNIDDECFKWDERFLPMKKALLEQGYKVEFKEGNEGGHNLTGEEVDLARNFISKRFGYFDDYEIIESKPEEIVESDITSVDDYD